MASSFMRYLNISTQLTPAATTGNPNKNVLIFGQRVTNGTLIPAKNGFPQPNYYIPFLLPSFSNGTDALAYLANYGIKSTIGINFTLALPAPTTITNTGSTQVLTWSAIPYGFSQLTEFVLSGTLSQLAINATVRTAAIVSGVATLTVTGNPAFIDSADSGTSMTLTGVNNVQYPDPIASDPIALEVWDFYQTALSAAPSTNGVPAAYISILSDRDTSVTANPAAIALEAPTSVVVNVDSSVTLQFTYTDITSLANFGYLPTTAYGSTTITQATSTAHGTYGGFIISPTSSTAGTVSITVTGVTGSFDATHTLSVVLANNINGFNFLNNITLYSCVLQWPINSLTNINTTYADFFNGVAGLNLASQVLNGHYGTYGMAGNITSLPSSAASLPIANDQRKILVTYPYVAKFGDIPYDNSSGTVASGRIAACVAYMLANGDAPFPPVMGSTIKHLPVSTVANTTSYSFDQFGTGNIAVTQGWLPMSPNSNNVVQLLESNTTLITIPNTTTPDTEFRYTHIWDCVTYITYQVAQLYNTISVLPNNAGSALISPKFLSQFQNGIISILVTAQSLGVVENVELYQNLVKVTQDTINPNQVNAYVPSQIIPQLNGANVLINVFSSLFQFNTQGA